MAQFSLTSATNLFKIKYGKLSENVYNSANVMQGRIKKNYNFTGKELQIPTPMSFQGGVGSGSLPTANAANYSNSVIESKKVYSVVEIQREAIKASMNNEGAFVQGTKEVVQKGVESYMRNCSRILFGKSDGILGVGDGAAADVTGLGTEVSPYVVTFSAANFKESNWEEKDFVQVVTGLAGGSLTTPYTSGTAEATMLEVWEVLPASYQVKFVGTSARLAALVAGPDPIATTDGFALQNSFMKDPMGLLNVLMATSGTLYDVQVGRRWQASQLDAGSAGISTDLMNYLMLEVQRKSGKVPNIIMTSFKQFRKVLNLLEDQKQYVLDPRSTDLKGKISFKGVEFMSSAGAVAIFPERFCDDDKMYFLNDNFIEAHHRPDFGWFEDDGTVFLRKADDDAYEARYGGYYQNYIIPSFHGVLYNLA